ncbi:MAG: PEP-CTERM sorting domain-containing protein [Candidatus Berkelbacteria bacterium]|nr:PEP-CTERM sorting domain-containing protein [Candidatus Berkelbacteria bacterium]
MRICSLFICLAVLTLVGSTAHALLWNSVEWGTYNGASLSIAGSDLVVGSGSDYAAAHYNTPSEFRSALTPWVEFSFLDNGPGTQRAQLWIEKEGTPGAAWFQFGSWTPSAYPTYDKYAIYWWNVDTDVAGWQWLDDRTADEHTLKVGKNADNSIDYWFDNSLVWTTTDINPDYFGDVYLASRNGESIFTNYQTGADYQGPPVPEPASIALLALASIGVAGAIRKKKA